MQIRTKTTISAFIVLLAFCVASLHGAETANQSKLSVLKKGNRIYIRSSFSASQDLVCCMDKVTVGNCHINFRSTSLIPAGSAIDKPGKVIHTTSDDSCPVFFNGMYIGGNHGSTGARIINSTAHGLTTADIGSAWQDGAGTFFFLLKIINENKLCFMSENQAEPGFWKFITTFKGDKLTQMAGDKTVAIEGTPQFYQLRPAIRIIEQKFLLNGTDELKDNAETDCSYFDIVDSHEILAPDTLLDVVKLSKGKEIDFADEAVEPYITQHITYRFQPMGACTIMTKFKANREIKLRGKGTGFCYMGFVQTAPLVTSDDEMLEMYVPKTVPMKAGGKEYDFSFPVDVNAVENFPTVRFFFSAGSADKNNLPERFIQLAGSKEKPRQVGFAIGYSLFEGITRPEIRAKTTLKPGTIYKSRKIYPAAFDTRMTVLPEDKELYCIAYRQYFNPALNKDASALYMHKQEDSLVVYADYHKSVTDNKISLPSEYTGKKISVLEKSPSLTTAGDTVSEEGISVTVKDKGYVVLKID
ncbi:MAG: hypothetical protein ACYTFY_14040 [Planctomycetota bacterium]|jgi:hypothetical protein